MEFHLASMKALRQKFNLTQFEVCRYLEVSDVSYRMWESRIRRPKEENYKRVKAFFLFLIKHESEITDHDSAIRLLDEEFEYAEN